MKLIFLDFDGVLNSLKWMRTQDPQTSICTHTDIDPVAVARLMDIVNATDAYIIVSSSWRKVCMLPELQDILGHHGVPRHRIIGSTPSLATAGQAQQERGDEISWTVKTWRLYRHPIESFVILDDGDDMGTLIHRLVLTGFNDGLLDKHVEQALKILDDPWEPDLELADVSFSPVS